MKKYTELFLEVVEVVDIITESNTGNDIIVTPPGTDGDNSGQLPW